MICGLRAYVTTLELPDGYAFSVQDDHMDSKPVTNGDRIRAMSDEELVAKFWEVMPDGEFCTGSCNEQRDCNICRLAWLRQPAELEDGT